MPQEQTCPQCSQPLPGDARTRGLCPWCLLRRAFGPDQPAGAAGGFSAPDAAELADEFPDIEVLELLGQGGMAAVYKARQKSLDRTTAIKVFPRQPTDDPTFAERFRNEARILARLNHPHIVAAYEFGQSERYCYFVMEFIDGFTLRKALRNKPLAPSEAVEIAYQICDALAFAHSHGVVHRDIKPENILFEGPVGMPVTGSGRIRVADFGLAKLLARGELDFTLTAPAHMLGTVHYMAPEQTETPERVDHRADIYAVGVVLYEMLTGQLPIGRFDEPSALADVDEQVDAVVMRCLAKSPDERFDDAEQLRDALGELAPSAVRAAPRRYARPRDRRRLRYVAAAAAGAAILAVAMLVPWGRMFSAGSGARPDTPGRKPLVTTETVALWLESLHRRLDHRQDAPKTAPAAPSSRPGRPYHPTTQLAPTVSLPPEFFVPYAHFHGPEFKDFRRGRLDWIRQVSAKHGADRIAAVWVHNLPGNVGTFVLDEVVSATGVKDANRTAFSTYNFKSMHVLVAPVDDVSAMAAKLGFGEVTRVDAKRRTVVIEADPAKLPPPLAEPVRDPTSPRFYEQNLADLKCWSRHRRSDASGRIRDAQPTKLRTEIAAALAALLTDKGEVTRRRAAEALGKWGSSRQVPALIEALSDPKKSVRVHVIASLGALGDARAAAPVAALLATDGPQAAACLRQLGPAAEAAVLDVLTGSASKSAARLAAAGVLADIGTARSISALQAAAARNDRALAEAARKALTAIQRRRTPSV